MEDGEEQARDTFAHFGLAMYLAQVLEHGVVNALVILRLPERGQMSRQDIDDFMEGRFQKTLGTLLRQLKSEIGSIPGGLDLMLSGALRLRNFLAHDYFRERAEQFVTRGGCGQMIRELQDYQELFDKADKLLGDALAPLRNEHGITDAMLDEEYKKMCRSLGILP